MVIGGAIAWFGFLKPEPLPISEEDRAQVNLMPLPAKMTLGEGKTLISGGLEFDCQLKSTRLDKAMNRFNDHLKEITGESLEGENPVFITITCEKSSAAYPTGEEDESYSLSIKPEQIVLHAPTELGIFHGLETLLQLAQNDHGEWYFPEAEITDQPRYPWRGLMIDVSRHWIPKEVILRNIDAMAAVKLNVFHWHLTDYQGFRMESKAFPKLHEMGSNGDYYTQEEVKEIIEYAADRGIRVIPEFDLPGHATSWFVGHPELAVESGSYELPTSALGIFLPLLDPTKEEVYEFLDTFFGEMAALFPDNYMHIGGDEINSRNWDENEEIQAFIKENNLEDAHGLQAYFNQRIQKIFEKHGKKMLGWDEILHPDLPKNGIAVQSWRTTESLWEAARAGNKAILSAGYYLDHQQFAEFHYQADPTVIPNAVTIEIDSNNWKSWTCKMKFRETEFDGDFYLFGEGEDLRGVMKSPMGIAGIEEISTEGNSLTFGHEAPFGNLTYNLELNGDSLNGEISVAIFEIVVTGERTGGSDMPEGTPLPEFAKIEPLTPEQEKNILGGEACMWTEMVNEHTIDSRIWPRLAAIAEKLWTPKDMTVDVKDMYRRLMAMDLYILTRGIEHRSSGEKILQEMVSQEYLPALRTLTSVLKEQKMFGRMIIYEDGLLTTSPMNQIVDASRSESYIAYQFGQKVDEYLDSKDEHLKNEIINQLEIWSQNHNNLKPAFEEVERLKEVENHSINLGKMSWIALSKLNGRANINISDEEIEGLIELANSPAGGTMLSVAPHIQKLILN